MYCAEGLELPKLAHFVSAKNILQRRGTNRLTRLIGWCHKLPVVRNSVNRTLEIHFFNCVSLQAIPATKITGQIILTQVYKVDFYNLLPVASSVKGGDVNVDNCLRFLSLHITQFMVIYYCLDINVSSWLSKSLLIIRFWILGFWWQCSQGRLI